MNVCEGWVLLLLTRNLQYHTDVQADIMAL